MNRAGASSFFELGINRNQSVYTAPKIPVQGQIPQWLEGNYVRNGPGMFNLKGRRLNHWFDGMGALHSFNIRNGQVDYLCKFIECRSYDAAVTTGELQFSEFASDPCRSIFKKVQSYIFPSLPNMTDNPKIHVARIGKSCLAMGETPMQVEFDPRTLERIGVRKPLPGMLAYKTTAHPHFEKGQAYNLVVQFGMQSHYRIYPMNSGRRPIASVPVAKPAYLHGFGMSQKYFIIAAGPLVVVPLQLLFWKKPYIENHRWLPEEGGQIWVIEKSTGKLKARFETEPFFSFHHVNAWEEGEELIMDLNAYPDASIISKYYLRELEKPDVQLPGGFLERYRLNLSTRKATHERISDAVIELPRIDYERYNTRGDYGFVYGVSLHPQHPLGFYNSIVKINSRTGASTYWYQEGCYPGEPLFVPKPTSRNDEEGLLISVVLDTVQQNSFLVLLDATTLQEVGRATVPEPILYGFHGEFFSESSTS